MAFALTEDHTRQEAAYERLYYNRDASTIRRMLTETHVCRHDRRAIFVGAEKYTEVGGAILRDLFTEDRAAAISRTWRCSICWSRPSLGAKPTRCRNGGGGLEMGASLPRLPT